LNFLPTATRGPSGVVARPATPGRSASSFGAKGPRACFSRIRHLAPIWRHPVAEYPISGDAVHRQLRAESGLAVLSEHVEEDFLLDVLVRPPVRSVARRDGLLG